MAEKVVELRKTQDEQAAPAIAMKPARSRASLRLVLLVVVPLIAEVGRGFTVTTALPVLSPAIAVQLASVSVVTV